MEADPAPSIVASETVEAWTGKVRVSVEPDMEREVEALKLLVRIFVIRRPGLAVVQHEQQRNGGAV